ncbi:Hypothetical protein A7982_00901 [Minicystis rosea]|nr:Hypothetical protein A7982_00901 [Minicystis rosea]
MRLRDVRDAITALYIREPWSYTGADFIETLASIDLKWGPIVPPFDLDQNLAAPFLLVRHTGHVPESRMDGFRILPDLELEILSGAGFMNNFVTHCVAFVAGRAAPFRILFRDESGGEVVFDKAQQLDEGDYGRPYPGRRIEWL